MQVNGEMSVGNSVLSDSPKLSQTHMETVHDMMDDAMKESSLSPTLGTYALYFSITVGMSLAILILICKYDRERHKL